MPATSRPHTLTRPDCGLRMPAIKFSSVLFPEPLGPRSMTFSPGAMLNFDTLNRAPLEPG